MVVRVRGDEVMLQQVVVNLMRKAGHGEGLFRRLGLPESPE